MKKVLSVFLSLCMIVSCMVGLSLTAGADGVIYSFDVDTGKLTISGSGTITYLGVRYACGYYSNLKTVEITGTGITSIGSDAFKVVFTNLTTVNISPDTPIESIGNNAFANCTSLSSITIPDSVTSIGDSAFHDCRALSSINLPDSVTSIGGAAFGRCTSLSSITIPDGVTSIAAFGGCSNLTQVTLPDSVTSIDRNAFYGCSSLTSITIPDSVTSIGFAAFANCTSLTSITIPDSVTSIGENAFLNCSSLTSITIPADVTIDDNAFDECTSLTTVNFGGTPTEWDSLDNKPANVTSVVYTMASGTKVTLVPEYAAYDGNDHTPTITVKKGDTTLTKNTHYTVTYSAEEFIEPGTYTITITGKSPYTGTKTVEFEIIGLKITTTSLHAGKVGTAYSQTLNATGGTGNKTWTVSAGSLPAGLTLSESGVISGTSTTAGTYNFTVKVTDSNNNTATKALSLAIKNVFTVKYDANGGSGTMADTVAADGDQFELPACGFTAPEEKIFDHWEVSGADGIYAPGNELLVASNLAIEGVITVTACWKADPNYKEPVTTYSIKVTTDGHGKGEADFSDAEAGKLITLTATPDEGYVFSEWQVISGGIAVTGGSFIMPSNDVEVKAIFDVYVPAPAPTNPYMTLNNSGGTGSPSTPTTPKIGKIELNVSGDTVKLSWKENLYIDSYTVYIIINGSKKELVTTNKNTVIVKGLKNGVTYDFLVAFTVDGKISPDESAGKATVTPYYKPAPKAKATEKGISLSWKSVPNADSYIVYKVVNGKLKKIAETAKTNVLISGLTSGKEYTFAVRAVINGKKTTVKKNDLVKATAV